MVRISTLYKFFLVSEEIFFEVGARIAALRGAMKQSEFAEQLGVNRQTVSRWEAGERLPDGSSLLRMRETFGADINVLLDGKEGGAAPDLRPDEEKLLADYRAAHSDARERIRQIAATAATSPKRYVPKADTPASVNKVKVSSTHGHAAGRDVHVNQGGPVDGGQKNSKPGRTRSGA